MMNEDEVQNAIPITSIYSTPENQGIVPYNTKPPAYKRPKCLI
jgi:hypothetical protein